jgi:hypothetical protein
MLSGIGPLVGIVFVGVILFITGCNMSNQQMVSTLVPPPENGNCVLKSATDGGNGDGNCNSSVGDKTAGGLNSTSYEEKVNKWDARGGTNLAKKCFNDTVCRSESAGVDPKIALTIWLSESSASNYTTPRTGMDFGISSAARKNFNAQITVFLKQPAAMLAECGNKNSGTATEKFIATFVRTETGVCPDPKTGEGKKYVDYIRMMYQFLFNKDLPNTPLMTASGDSCGTGNSDALSENTREVTDPEGNVWVCKENAGGSGGDQTASLVPATPIYDNSCLSSPAYCVVDYLINNGVLIVDRSNVEKVAKLIDQWQNAPSNFNKAAFNSAMIASATTVGPEYVFQCVGFAVAVNSELGNSAWGGSVSSWDGMIAHGSAGCPRIEPSGAGVGDFILFPSGSWYHVVVLSKLSSDGSFSISQANWGAPGKLSNVEGSNISAYLNGKSVLRCK